MKTRSRAASRGASLAAIICISAIMSLAVQARTFNPQATVLLAVAPVYPPIAVAANAGGTVETDVAVDAAGEVTSTQATTGHPLLRQAAENAARRWRFVATGYPQSVHLTFVFRIMPKETKADELTMVFTPPYQIEVRHRAPEPIIHSDPPAYVRPTLSSGGVQEDASYRRRQEPALQSGRLPVRSSSRCNPSNVVPSVDIAKRTNSDEKASVVKTAIRTEQSKVRKAAKEFNHPEPPEIIQNKIAYEAHTLAGRIADPTGAALEEVCVERLGSDWKKRVGVTFTDAGGAFSFSQYTGGTQFLRISKPGFNTLLVKVKIKRNLKPKAPLSIKLGFSR